MNPSTPTPEQSGLVQPEQQAGMPRTEAAPLPVAEAAPAAPSNSPAATPVVSVQPFVPTRPDPTDPTAPAVAAPIAGAPPTVAEDVDVIEKEWVDQAEAVVKRTAGDPHAEEVEVEALQVDYLKKRYDHTVGSSEE